MIGAVIDGQARPLEGGPGRDRVVGGAIADLLEGDGAVTRWRAGAARTT